MRRPKKSIADIENLLSKRTQIVIPEDVERRCEAAIRLASRANKRQLFAGYRVYGVAAAATVVLVLGYFFLRTDKSGGSQVIATQAEQPRIDESRETGVENHSAEKPATETRADSDDRVAARVAEGAADRGSTNIAAVDTGRENVTLGNENTSGTTRRLASKYEIEIRDAEIRRIEEGYILVWKNPVDSAFSKVIVERSIGGETIVVYSGSSELYIDTELPDNDEAASYRIISMSKTAERSPGVVIDVR